MCLPAAFPVPGSWRVTAFSLLLSAYRNAPAGLPGEVVTVCRADGCQGKHWDRAGLTCPPGEQGDPSAACVPALGEDITSHPAKHAVSAVGQGHNCRSVPECSRSLPGLMWGSRIMTASKYRAGGRLQPPVADHCWSLPGAWLASLAGYNKRTFLQGVKLASFLPALSPEDKGIKQLPQA